MPTVASGMPVFGEKYKYCTAREGRKNDVSAECGICVVILFLRTWYVVNSYCNSYLPVLHQQCCVTVEQQQRQYAQPTVVHT